jgi:hypothetical protein
MYFSMRARVTGFRPSGRDRGDAVRRNQDAGAELDPARLHRGCAHRGEHFGVQQLGVEEIDMGEAEFFRPLHHLPGISRRRQLNTEIQRHSFPLSPNRRFFFHHECAG